MDFSLFGPLLALREELGKAADLGVPHDKNTIALLKRVAQERERTLVLLAKAAPASDIGDVLRAAAAPLPVLPDEDTRLKLTPKARRSLNTIGTPGKATKIAKTAKPTKPTKPTKTTKATKARSSET